MSPLPERQFIGWDGPALERAADWLLERFGAGQESVVVALPGNRAVRRLEELLARRAEAGWRPPRVLTQGQLTDELCALERPVAGRLVRTLAWERALARLEPRRLARLSRLAGAEGEGLTGRVRLAATVRGLHGQLAPEGLEFADLARGEARPDSPGEAARWETLAAAQEAYRTVLAELDLDDPHEARSAAIESGRIDFERRVVLVGVADLNRLLRRVLAEVAERTSVLIAAPAELAGGFDEYGALQVDYWRRRDVPIETETWRVAEKPVDQADAAMQVLREWAGRFQAEELTIGVADEQVTPYLERRLATAGVHARIAAGLAIERTRPFRLLAAVARFVERRRYADLAALVRHPDLEPRLHAGQGLFGSDPAAALDAYHEEHLPDSIDGRWVDDAKLTPAVRSMHETLLALLGPLADGPRTIGAWAIAVRELLERVYAGRELDPGVESERVLAAALGLCRDALDEMQLVPDALLGQEVTGADALSLLASQLAGRSVAPRPQRAGEPTVELLGWLELALDDAPALVVTGFNEGRVPESVHGHPFLPDGVRKRLHLPDNDARLARDVYACSVLIHARRATAFVTGRRSLEGDPLVPSRLAFHVPEVEIVERVRRFLPEDDGRARERVSAAPAGVALELPRAAERAAPETMSVSSFKEYLASPYGYYLRYVLRLKTLDDRARELEPRQFGTLAHDALFEFGRAEVKDAADARTIERYLCRTVDRLVKERFGRTSLPAIALQAEQLKYRMKLFARCQAAWFAQGWRIAHVEHETPEDGIPLEVDGRAVGVRGRIDRIDRHPSRGWAVLDYKTGEMQRKGPAEVHRGRDGSWRDLQLPLYAHLARGLGLEGELALGYGALGKDEASIGFRLAEEWTPAIIEEGLEAARDVVRCVRAGRFEAVGRLPFDAIPRAICGEGVIGATAGADGGGAP